MIHSFLIIRFVLSTVMTDASVSISWYFLHHFMRLLSIKGYSNAAHNWDYMTKTRDQK